MKWRLTIAAAVVAVVAAVVGSVVALAGGSTGPPAAHHRILHPARHWLREHAYVVPGQRSRVDVSDVAETLLRLDPNYRKVHHVHTYNAIFRDEVLTQACTYIFGHAGGVNHDLHVHRFRFDLQASGPSVSPLKPGGTDHDGYALQCGYSHGPLGAHLLELAVSSGGVTLHNLTTYARARRRSVTGGLSFGTRPHGLPGKPRVHEYLRNRLARAAFLD